MKIMDRTKDCGARKDRILVRKSITHLFIHRISLSAYDPANPYPIMDGSLDAIGLADRFKNVGLGTAGNVPYHFLIRSNGPMCDVEQMIPLSLKGCHAGSWNWRSIAIALCGDFRKLPPSQEQFSNLIWLVSLIAPMNGGLDVVGHTDVPSTSADPHKICPGRYLHAQEVLARAILLMPENWRMLPENEVNDRLISAGVIL